MASKKGNAAVVGTSEDDELNGTPASEWVYGLAGDDRLYGNGGNDHLYGGDGNDLLVGGAGNDELFGGDGRDFLVSGGGNDHLAGGAGSDKFEIRLGTGKETILDFQADDKLDLRSFGFASAEDALNAFDQSGRHAVLDLGGGDRVILKHVDVDDLDAGQFIVADAETGPSSSDSPYVLPVDPAISTVALLTVGDQIGFKSDGVTPWLMVGIPDGLGAFDNNDGTFTVLMNHELRDTQGVVREHGSIGAFVSSLTIDKVSLEVTEAHDLVQQVYLFDTATSSYVLGSDPDTAFSRFCSADLADAAAFFNPVSGLGYDGGRLFLNGEEAGSEGGAFAHIASGPDAGISYELPALGKMSFENAIAHPGTGDKTVVAVTDDGDTSGIDSHVYFYFGDKQATGNAVEKAGLTGGSLYGIQVTELDTLADNNNESDGTDLGGDFQSNFSLVNLGNVTDKDGATLNSDGEAAGVTSFLRPEDGAWDTQDPDRFYFVSTNNFTGPSRLWSLDFDDASDPSAGGTITMLLDGTEGQKMMDNIAVTKAGKVLIQEDPGNQEYLARIWEYDPATDTMIVLGEHDADRFATGAPNFLTRDEESSGIIDVTDILGSAGQNVFLFDTQAHYNISGELVQGGQLQLMYQDLA
jgi:hypothetical protein